MAGTRGPGGAMRSRGRRWSKGAVAAVLCFAAARSGAETDPAPRIAFVEHETGTLRIEMDAWIDATGKGKKFTSDATLEMPDGTVHDLLLTVRANAKKGSYKYAAKSPRGAPAKVKCTLQSAGAPEVARKFALLVKSGEGTLKVKGGGEAVVLAPYEAELADAVGALLDDGGDPQTFLVGYQDLVEDSFAGRNPVDGLARTMAGTLVGVRSEQDFRTLVELSEGAGGSVFTFRRQPGPGEEGAPEIDPLCPGTVSDSGVVVYYINGINNLITTAQAGAQMLAQIVDDPDCEVRLFYNQSGTENPVWQNACNRITADITGTLGSIIGLVSDSGAEAVLRFQASLYSLCVSTGGFSEDLIEAATQWVNELVAVPVDPGQAAAFANLILQDVLSGKRVVVVAHSQGNLFTVAALNEVAEWEDGYGNALDAVAVVSVATPTSYSGLTRAPASLTFVNLKWDPVSALSGLPQNVVNPLSSASNALTLAVHGFSESYLAYEESRAYVTDGIETGKDAAVNDREDAGQGYFQVTLTWNIPGDIDLHVDEPSGFHVYYASREGFTGTLDRDDLTGTGPENYFVCDRESMDAGTYDISVNNFSGTTGTLATVTIRAGSQTRTFQIVMDAANYNTTLLPAGTVTYHGDGTFTIEEP